MSTDGHYDYNWIFRKLDNLRDVINGDLKTLGDDLLDILPKAPKEEEKVQSGYRSIREVESFPPSQGDIDQLREWVEGLEGAVDELKERIREFELGKSDVLDKIHKRLAELEIEVYYKSPEDMLKVGPV